MNKTVLLFNFSPERTRDIRAALKPLGCTARAVLKKEQKKTAGQLLGLSAGIVACEDAEFDEEFILISGYSGVGLDLVLKVLSASGAGRGTLKAIVTETNVDWTCAKIFAEVLKDHKAMNSD